MISILGMGNALVDVVTNLTGDNQLNDLNLPKGSMQLVDNDTMAHIVEQTKHLPQTLASGGSAANTTNGLSNLGIATAFIGKVGIDETGRFFEEDMVSAGIKPMLLKGKSLSGRALALVSPDSERTFAVHLGAAIELVPEEITADLFAGHTHFHIEGYLVQDHALIERALQLAKEANLTISIDLASYNVVKENLEFLRRIVKEYVDIVFANEEEAKAFTGKEPMEALNEIATMAEIAIVKLGAKGSAIKSGESVTTVGVAKANPIDTTGAGDMYAAGFLYGHAQGLSHRQSGEIGALLSGKVIEVLGPKMDAPTWKMLREQVERIKKGESII